MLLPCVLRGHFDNDGDVDLFVGAGRVNGALSRDYLFDNNHSQGGSTLFSRNNSSPLGFA